MSRLSSVRQQATLFRAELFRANTFGYQTYRIPAVIDLGAGVVLVAAEGRRDGVNDWGQIDLVIRRSCDGGHTFDAQRTVVTDAGYTCGNPTWLYDATKHVLTLLFCKNGADEPEALVLEGKAQRTVWLCQSNDDGLTFSTPREITNQVKPADWTWYATGPGHGLTLHDGRWVVPCCHAVGVTKTREDPVRSHLLVSDDHGATWRVGAIVDQPRSSECGIVEVAPNVLYVDFRNDAPPHSRGGALSVDGGDRITWHTLHDSVTDPGCRGGACGGARPGEVYLSHPRGPKRRDLVLEHSSDGGRTFTQLLHIAAGCAAYSDLVSLTGSSRPSETPGDLIVNPSANEDGARDGLLLGCAFETGEATPYERIDWCHIG